MKLAHLILVHTETGQLERLINRLSHPNADIYIHLDKKTPIRSFEHLKNNKNIYFIKNRVKVYWGTYSIVQATLNGLKEIAASGKNYQYLNLLSEQDYPLKSQEFIYNHLSENPGKAFMNFLPFESEWLEALPRIHKYHFNNFQIPGRYILQRIVNMVLPQRTLPDNLIPVGRSQWFTISMECVNYIIDYWESHGKLRRFIKLTWGPDEFVFQTILYNSIHKGKMVNEDLRYIDWSAGGVSPKIFSLGDANTIVNSGKLFARKFDINTDETVLDYIDNSM